MVSRLQAVSTAGNLGFKPILAKRRRSNHTHQRHKCDRQYHEILPGGRVYAVKRAFTLIELLVVIAVIAILAALLLPAMRAAKEQAQGVQCLGQIKQFSYAWNMYTDDNEEWIPPNYASGGPAQID